MVQCSSGIFGRVRATSWAGGWLELAFSSGKKRRRRECIGRPDTMELCSDGDMLEPSGLFQNGGDIYPVRGTARYQCCSSSPCQCTGCQCHRNDSHDGDSACFARRSRFDRSRLQSRLVTNIDTSLAHSDGLEASYPLVDSVYVLSRWRDGQSSTGKRCSSIWLCEDLVMPSMDAATFQECRRPFGILWSSDGRVGMDDDSG